MILQVTTTKPVARWLHGLGSNCIIESGNKRFFKGMDIECIGSGAGYISSFESQYQSACSQLEKEEEVLKKDGFTLIGFSQGGLLARAVLQRCSIGKYIRRLVTFGGPHSGVAIIPFTSASSFMNKSVLRLCFFGAIQHLVGPCGYIRSTKYFDSYHSANNFVADLNNEFSINSEYVKRIQNLEAFVAVQFLQDQMVQPYNTSTFGYYKDSSYQDYSELEDLEIYSKDKLGLKNLIQNGKMLRCDIDGDHLDISENEMISFAVNVHSFKKSLISTLNNAI